VKIHKLTDHILINRKWYSDILDVRIFRGASRDAQHYLMVAKFRERLAASQQAAQKLDEEIYTPRKLSELGIRK